MLLLEDAGSMDAPVPAVLCKRCVGTGTRRELGTVTKTGGD